MDRSIPVSNKLLSQLWTAQNHNLHMLKLKQMRPTINVRGFEPKQYMHLQQRRKKEQLAEGNIRIERISR